VHTHRSPLFGLLNDSEAAMNGTRKRAMITKWIRFDMVNEMHGGLLPAMHPRSINLEIEFQIYLYLSSALSARNLPESRNTYHR
jgi:hypothetical protein